MIVGYFVYFIYFGKFMWLMEVRMVEVEVMVMGMVRV
jgi:hypothetical protein